MDLRELENISDLTIKNARKYSLQCFLLFSFMRLYGLRFSDVCTSEWMADPRNKDSIIIIQQKTQNLRTISISTVEEYTGTSPWNIRFEANKYTYSYYRLKFMQFCRIVLINGEGKRIETHLFRHLKAKEVYEQTHDIKSVKDAIGVSSVSVAWNYVRSEIRKE